MVSLDGNVNNADWAKQSWDLGIDNIEALLDHIKATGRTPQEFMKLPVYQRNVAKMPWLKDLAKYAK